MKKETFLTPLKPFFLGYKDTTFTFVIFGQIFLYFLIHFLPTGAIRNENKPMAVNTFPYTSCVAGNELVPKQTKNAVLVYHRENVIENLNCLIRPGGGNIRPAGHVRPAKSKFLS